MKKLILTILVAMVLSLCVFAEGEADDGCLNLDFDASYSEDKADMLGVRVKDGFHVSVIKGKLSPISSFGIPLTFVFEDEKLCYAPLESKVYRIVNLNWIPENIIEV